MKQKIQRTLSVLLTVIILTGAVCVSAQAYNVEASAPGDPNPTHSDLPYDKMGTLYFDSVHVAKIDQFDWPDSGSVYVQIAGKYTLSDLNGATIPAGLLVDVYQASGSQYLFRVRYDTRSGTPVTVTNAVEDAERDAGTGGSAGNSVAGFSDVRSSDYYADAVAWAAESGVTGGTSATTFSPGATVTRAQAVTFLWAAAGRPEPASRVSPFVDVDQNDYYCQPVLWAAENGITAGVSADHFGPDVTLAYDQIFTFLSKTAGESGVGADWSAAAVNWADESGLTAGLTYTAKGACPRSDLVYCLWKQLGNGWTREPDEAGQAISGGRGDLTGARAAIEQGLLAMDSAIDVSTYGVEAADLLELAEEIVNVEGYEDSSFGYYGVNGLWCLEEAGQTARTLLVRYSGVDADRLQRNRDLNDAIQRAVEQSVEPGMGDYEMAKALHDYVVLNSAYGYPSDVPQVIDGGYLILVRGMGVCTDYAQAYKELMDAVGIPCEVVFGIAGGASHAWNVVQIDGAWYHVDTTWDDPTPNREGYVRYDYFLKSDSYMRRDHTQWDETYPCTSTKYDNADLPDATQQQEQQEKQQEQETFSEIRAALDAAIADLPYQTREELQGATYDELMDARNTYVTLDDSYSTLILREAYQAMADALRAQYPELSVYYDREHHGYRIYRNDLVEEIQRRQGAEREEQEQQQAQENVENAAMAAEIVPILERAIAEMDCETKTITLTDYTDNAIKQACKNMCTDGYSFGDYTYSLPAINADYSVSAQSGGVVKLTNKKWAEAELQRYVEQIEEAIDDGEFSVKLLPGNYPDQDGSHYAFNAYNRVRKDGYTTASGKVSGEDYVLFSGGSNKDTDVFSASIQYPLPVMDEEEAQSYYIGLIEDAIRNRETEVQFQYKFGDQDYSDAAYAAQRAVTSSGYEVDSLVYWTDYRLSLGTNSYSGIMTITIQYQQAPAAPQGG